MQSPSKWDGDSYASLGLLRAGRSFILWILRSDLMWLQLYPTRKNLLAALL